MLSRKYRASRSDIENTIKTGINIPGTFLYAKVSRNDKEEVGFAIVISKKIEKTSVGRHQLKRKISAAIEKNLLKAYPAFKKVIVFFPKKSKTLVSYSEIEKDIEKILKKLDF